MIFSQNHFLKFILVSVAIHLSVVGLFLNISHHEDQHRPIEIVFGTGPEGASGNGLPVAKAAAPKPIKLSRPQASAPKKVVVEDAPKAASEKVSKPLPQEVSAADTQNVGTPGGTGVGTGKGNGSGNGTGDGGDPNGSKSVLSKYAHMIAKLINKHKKYPRMAYSLNQEGKVIVELKLSKEGKIIELKVLEKSPYKSLATASLETIKSINKFPPIPKELKVTEISFNIPIEYKIDM